MLLFNVYFSEYFEGNPNIPIYDTECKPYLAERIVSLLFQVEDDKICSEQPLACTRTASFVVNCNNLSHSHDIQMDDSGSWINGGVDRLYFSVKFSDDKTVSSIKKFHSCPSVLRKSVYCLTRSYWKHKQNNLFNRQLF